MDTADFDFELPAELIAQHPVEPRDQSRLMVVRRGSGMIEHHHFHELPDLLEPGDCLVRNDTKVVPARLIGHRVATGGKWSGLFLNDRGNGCWEILATTRGHPAEGEQVEIDGGLVLTLKTRGEAGRWMVQAHAEGEAGTILARHGRIPLPPYIRKGMDDPTDHLRYQTLYAQVPGAVAAPTAGLHFTEEVFRRLDARGVEVCNITLHVGVGTFRPIETEKIEDHTLHAEMAELTETVAEILRTCRSNGGKIVAVGTTSARTLETAVSEGGFRAFRGETALYLRPGHHFRGVDALLTNFHLPRSSLRVLVAAFAGVDLSRVAYDEAIRHRYRFYSYGDAMLLL